MAEAVTETEWQELRRKSRDAMSPETLGNSLPVVLLPYQQDLLNATAKKRAVVVVEKSRRIGATWGIAADAVLTSGAQRSAGGMDTFYIGYNLEMTREFVDTCASWSKAFAFAASSVDEFLFDDGQDDEGGSRHIKAFRIRYASGFEIVALCSQPRSLRGKQGYVILDEAAFHDQLREVLKAAMALRMWGGKVLIISTHNGVENDFNALVQDIHAGKLDYQLIRCTFDEALSQGLYKRICLVTGEAWSAAAEAEWRKDIRRGYGDAAAEELDCVPAQGGGKYLSRMLLEARADASIPVVRWSMPDGFVDATDEARAAECRDWCEQHLRPLLSAMSPELRSHLGGDFGRSGDLSVFWPLSVAADLRRLTPFVVELRNIPFREQEQVLLYICDHMPRFSGAALDARGNGQYLAERARQRYGAQCVAQVMLTEAWYRENMPKMKQALEDDKLNLPADADTIDDLRALEMVRGVARIPENHTQGANGQRHGDSAVGLAMAVFASATLDAGPIEFSVDGQMTSAGAFGEAADHDLEGWN